MQQGNRMPFCRKITLSLIIASFCLCSAAIAKDETKGQKVVAPVVNTVPEVQIVPPVLETAAMEETVKPQIPAMAKIQVPGYYRTMIGQFEVTALFDGVLDFHPELLKNMDLQTIEEVLSHHYGRSTGIQTAINAYLIHTGDHLVLIDAGAGKFFSEDQQGRIVENLKAAGYQPEQVDTIIMTHLHGDHTGGLSDRDGIPIFPNATVYANRIENEYWLSEQQAAAAPVERQIFFKMARESAVPYLSSEKWEPVEAGSEVVPGIRAIAAYGHTPGHTAFEVTSDGQTLLIWGDIVHSHVIQFSHPDVAIEYDSETSQAVRTRRNLLKEVAAKRELVAGMHLPFPGLGYVVAEGDGKYSWIPVEYDYLSKNNGIQRANSF